MDRPQFPELPSKLERLEMARCLYIYGDGKRKPVRGTEQLAKLCDLTTLDIARHSTSWLAELRANAQSASMLYGNAITPEIVESHEHDVAWIREQIDLLQKKMDALDDDKKGLDTYEYLLKQVLKLQVRWSRLVGIDGALKVSEMVKLTLGREEAKLALAAEREKPPVPDGSNARPVSAKIFDMDEPETNGKTFPLPPSGN